MCDRLGPTAKNKGSKRIRIRKLASGVKLVKQLMLHTALNKLSSENMLKKSKKLRKGSLARAATHVQFDRSFICQFVQPPEENTHCQVSAQLTAWICFIKASNCANVIKWVKHKAAVISLLCKRLLPWPPTKKRMCKVAVHAMTRKAIASNRA